MCLSKEIGKTAHRLYKDKSITRHLFLCCDQSKAKCCSFEEGMKSWEYLKKVVMRLKQDPAFTANNNIARTKANCLQICVANSGPIGVIYPEGVWYKELTVGGNLEEVVEKHMMNGQIVDRLRIHEMEPTFDRNKTSLP